MMILKLLEADGLIQRIVDPQGPPKVEYEVTELASSLKEILYLINEGGEEKLANSQSGSAPFGWALN
ncbi:winged helix-turn-helix transcriptional regulator [Spirosoma foliorum]|uniref:Winged helix-turn-helix transcriptional regulator n=1 Tax=Spirosoma foliorum TaxID=2710596 RepID=A0A7G5GVV3_9BACT|nr:winged helix-turn-helix transcriptional regulator [Spirosoma foliorum]QMW02995.1 winged helix-turn-helix transcriptional regulator [Spirosoma foliorum]